MNLLDHVVLQMPWLFVLSRYLGSAQVSRPVFGLFELPFALIARCCIRLGSWWLSSVTLKANLRVFRMTREEAALSILGSTLAQLG